MTQIGIEYQKHLEQKRANLANESLKRGSLAEDIRNHDMQRQTSLDVAAKQAAASKYAADTSAAASKYSTNAHVGTSIYAADKSYAASKYATDSNLKKGTLLGAWDSGSNFGESFMNALGYLWDTAI